MPLYRAACLAPTCCLPQHLLGQLSWSPPGFVLHQAEDWQSLRDLSTICSLCRCFGRLAGAFRVYVEEEEGRLWGWYEGEQGGGLRAARPELGSALS